MDDDATITRFEQAAEAAYAAMYDAAPTRVKDFRDDAFANFQRAIEAARRLGRVADAARLKARLSEVEAVYNSQFRGVGR